MKREKLIKNKNMGFEKFPSPEQQKEAIEEKEITPDDVMDYFYSESEKAQEDESIQSWQKLGNYVQNGNFEIPLRFLEARLKEEDLTQQYRKLSECLREKVLKNEEPYDKQTAIDNFIEYVKEEKEKLKKEEEDEEILEQSFGLDRMKEEVKTDSYDSALLEMERVASVYAEQLMDPEILNHEEPLKYNLGQLKRARKLIQFFSKEK